MKEPQPRNNHWDKSADMSAHHTSEYTSSKMWSDTFPTSPHSLPTIQASFLPFLQGVSIPLLCKPCVSYDQDVRQSVHLSVTRWHWVKTTQARIKKSSPTDSSRTLVFGIKSSRNSKGFTPSEGVKWEWGRKNSQFSPNKSPYLRNGARQD